MLFNILRQILLPFFLNGWNFRHTWAQPVDEVSEESKA